MTTQMIISLALDVLVAVLLLFAIVYSSKLNRRIRVLQDSKSELAQLIEQFDESTRQATSGINEIHKASKKINAHIEQRLTKANYIADDLAFMIEKGGKIIQKIDDGPSARPAPSQSSGRSGRRAASAGARAGRNTPEMDDMDMQRDGERGAGAGRVQARRSKNVADDILTDNTSNEKANARGSMLGDMIDKIGNRGGAENLAGAGRGNRAGAESPVGRGGRAGRRGAKAPMSSSEQELYEALNEKI